MRIITRLVAAAIISAVATPAAAQIGGLGKLGKAASDVKKAGDDITLSEAEETQLGADVSGMLRNKYGVVQDKAVTRYVTLLGNAMAQKSSRPNLKWQFVVLDTDGINAFGAPGGFVHITRGALALVQDESQLAGVLGHEIAHITEKHTVNAIRNANIVGVGASLTRNELIKAFANKGYEIILENKFDRGQEMSADKTGTTLANQVGYAPNGMSIFLTRLMERNKGLKEPSGPFASHPEAQARQDGLKKVIGTLKPPAAALGSARYTSNLSYKLVAIDAIAQVAPPVYDEAKKEEKKDGGFKGLGKSLGGDKSGNQSVSSAGARGFNPDRDAKGGPIKTQVVVAVTAAEIAEFVKGIA